MAEHTHEALVEGCFRCDLNRDEAADLEAECPEADRGCACGGTEEHS